MSYNCHYWWGTFYHKMRLGIRDLCKYSTIVFYTCMVFFKKNGRAPDILDVHEKSAKMADMGIVGGPMSGNLCHILQNEIKGVVIIKVYLGGWRNSQIPVHWNLASLDAGALKTCARQSSYTEILPLPDTSLVNISYKNHWSHIYQSFQAAILTIQSLWYSVW